LALHHAAQKLGRRAVLIDASEDYIKLSVRRLEGIPLPMF
jgi:DNA modification methylase